MYVKSENLGSKRFSVYIVGFMGYKKFFFLDEWRPTFSPVSRRDDPFDVNLAGNDMLRANGIEW